MNTYVKKMREALGAFYEKALDHENNVNKANQWYKSDVAAKEIKRLDEQLETEKRAAIDAITEAKDKGIESAKRWGVLDGDKIKDGDMKLLKFDLSPEQFESIVNRNKNNGTMCFILKQYAEKHEKHETKDDAIPAWNSLAFAAVEVPTVDEKIMAYNAFAESAICRSTRLLPVWWRNTIRACFESRQKS